MASELSKFIDDELLRQGNTPTSARHGSPRNLNRGVSNGSGGLAHELSGLIEEELARSSQLSSASLLGDRRRQTLGIEATRQLEGRTQRRCCTPRGLLLSLLGFGVLMLVIVFISGHSGGEEIGDDDADGGLMRRPAGISDPNSMFSGDYLADFSDLYEYDDEDGELDNDDDASGGTDAAKGHADATKGEAKDSDTAPKGGKHNATANDAAAKASKVTDEGLTNDDDDDDYSADEDEDDDDEYNDDEDEDDGSKDDEDGGDGNKENDEDGGDGNKENDEDGGDGNKDKDGSKVDGGPGR